MDSVYRELMARQGWLGGGCGWGAEGGLFLYIHNHCVFIKVQTQPQCICQTKTVAAADSLLTPSKVLRILPKICYIAI